MAAITTRETGTTGTGGVTRKNLPLTNSEIDTNFININNAKLEITDTTDANTADKVVKRDSSGNFAAGTVTVTSLVATSITETSSIALKENISPISDGLDSVLSLNGVTYNRKDGTGKQEAGLIAEDVFKVLPNLVTLDKSGNPEGINYTKLSAYLIEAVKQLKTEIDILKSGK
jgi:hypothetical protein